MTRLTPGLLALLFLLPGANLALAVSAPTVPTATIQQQGEQLDADFSRIYQFLYAIRDPQSGGLSESIPDRNRNVAPRLESTARAVHMLKAGEAIALLPAHERQRICAYVQSFQDPVNGWFDDPAERRPIEERRGRAVGYARGALSLLQSSPLFPIPGSTSESIAAVPYLASSASFATWIQGYEGKEQA